MACDLKVAALFLAILLPAHSAYSQTIFSTDFEDVSDWAVTRPSPSGISFPNSWTLKPGGPSPQPPKKNDGSWLHPNSWSRIAPSVLPGPSTPMATIGAGQGRDGSRGMTYNVEVSGAAGTWTGGSPLTMYLGSTGYPELYVSMWVKYDPMFTWLPANPSTGSQQKLVYISRLNGILSSTSDADNHSNGPLHPSWLPHWYNYISASPYYAYYMNRSQQSNGSLVAYDQTRDMWSNHKSYYPQGGPFKWPESSPHVAAVQSDGAWHHYEYHVKMNTAPGLADGVQEVWLDGVQQFSKKDMPFVLTGGSTAVGWNYVELFDNANIISRPSAENIVYPIFIDNVLVATQYSGPPPPPVGITASGTSNTSIRVSWSAGDNGASFSLGGFRIYCTDPGGVTVSADVGNVTEYELTGLLPATQYTITVTALRTDSFAGEIESLRPPLAKGVTTDVVPPALTIDATPALTKTKSQALTGSVSDQGGLASVTVKVGALASVAASIDGSRWSCTVPALSEGGNVIVVTARDVSGNESVENRTITLDSTPPQLALAPVTTPSLLTSQTISGTVVDSSGVASVWVQTEGGERKPATVNGASWSCLLSGLLPGGSNKLLVSAQDAVGNETTQAATATIYVLKAGDLTSDLSVGVEDALSAMQMATGLKVPDVGQLQRGDLAPVRAGVPAPDGVIDTGDAIVILGIVVGLVKF